MGTIRALAFVLGCLMAGAVRGQSIEPAPDWQTADTPHFRVNYRAPWRDQAERVAQAAERAYPKVTKALGWQPRDRTQILLIDQYDSPNGFSTPLPYNIIGVFLSPPDEGELLDNSDWLDLLLMHEFTHAVHLDKARGLSGALRSVIGRDLLLFPNLFQPGWAIEGLAVYQESDMAGRGRLQGPAFEAWLRAESQTGFPSLHEMNAGGRTLPVSKAYLYGAYFFEFLARRYGPEAIGRYVDGYSGNPPLWPRLHTNPVRATGKTLDVLWAEFLVDLKTQVDLRAQPTRARVQAVGERVTGPLFGLSSVAGWPGGGALAVVDDGLHRPKLVRYGVDGAAETLAPVHSGAHVDVSPAGSVLVSQPDICRWRHLSYDLYRLRAEGGWTQLTHCARLRRAVQVGEGIAAIQQHAGATSLVWLDAQGQNLRVLWQPPQGVTLVDLAASRDGQHVYLATKQTNAWGLHEASLHGPGAVSPRQLLTHDAPIHGLAAGAAGLEFIAARDGVFNVWRLAGREWLQLSQTHTRVVAHTGTQDDGSMALSVVVPGGYALQRFPAVAALRRVAAGEAGPPAMPPSGSAASPLGEPQPYRAWRTMAPRAWWPLLSQDRGLLAVGASTFGADALGWHQYAGALQVETSQSDWQGSLQYLYQGQHLFSFQRELTPRIWRNGDDASDVLSYDRETRAQWLSTLPWLRLERRVTFGVGAAMDRVQRVNPDLAPANVPRDERLLAALIDYDTSGGNWWSEGANRGQRATLLYETYRPFARSGRGDYDGSVLRLDWRGHVPIGRHVLALRHTEVRSQGFTQRFQLGGAHDPQLQLGPTLNHRDVMLRGYRGDETGLQGHHARVTSVEWRSTLADVDRHLMVPAIGLNRLSGTLFFDIGGAWDAGSRPATYRRGVGAEVLAEVKLLYALGLHLRLGVARGLDAPRSTRAYMALGRGF